jgi:hypothetical protein
VASARCATAFDESLVSSPSSSPLNKSCASCSVVPPDASLCLEDLDRRTSVSVARAAFNFDAKSNTSALTLCSSVVFSLDKETLSISSFS